MSICAMSTSRTLIEVNDLLNDAKINRADLKPVTQCIYFDSPLNLDGFKLMEINNDLVHDLESGKKLIIKGSKEEPAVVCTEYKTFSVKEAEISNTMLILSNVQTDDIDDSENLLVNQTVVGMRRAYWEIKEEPIVKLSKLYQLLSENPYCGPEKENDESHSGKKYSLFDLFDQIPASDNQILDALSTMTVCEIDGYFRMLDFEYITRLMTEILNYIEENSWSWRCVDVDRTVATLSELEPSFVLRKWFELYAEKQENGLIWSLNETKICRLYAEILLNSVEKFHLRDFTETWKESVPVGMKTDFSMLLGLAIVEKDCKPPYVQYLPAERLSDDPNERFDKLFRVKQKWTFDEISPYVQSLASTKTDIGILLMKFCRCSIVGETKYYTSKHL